MIGSSPSKALIVAVEVRQTSSLGYDVECPRDRASLTERSIFVLISTMDNIDENRVAKAILAAPGWARVGISAPKESTREAAAQELALMIMKVSGDRPPSIDPDQLALAL